MATKRRWNPGTGALVLAIAAAASATPVAAQTGERMPPTLLDQTAAATETSRPVRLLRSWEEAVKLPGGGEYSRKVRLVLDYRKGAATTEYYDASGRRIGSRPIFVGLPSPSPAEVEEAFGVIRDDAELARILAGLKGDLTGGFVVQEGRGRPCGPGSRCLLVLVISPDHAGLIRRVVVDLAKLAIAYRTFDPTLIRSGK